LNEIIHR